MTEVYFVHLPSMTQIYSLAPYQLMTLVFVPGESSNCNADHPESDGEPVHRGVPRHGHPSQSHGHACSSHIVSAFCLKTG